MFQKVRVAVIKNTRPVYLAGLMSSLFFAVGMQKIDAQASLIARHGIYTGIFFLCMWVACRLFATGINRRLELNLEIPQQVKPVRAVREARSVSHRRLRSDVAPRA